MKIQLSVLGVEHVTADMHELDPGHIRLEFILQAAGDDGHDLHDPLVTASNQNHHYLLLVRPRDGNGLLEERPEVEEMGAVMRIREVRPHDRNQQQRQRRASSQPHAEAAAGGSGGGEGPSTPIPSTNLPPRRISVGMNLSDNETYWPNIADYLDQQHEREENENADNLAPPQPPLPRPRPVCVVCLTNELIIPGLQDKLQEQCVILNCQHIVGDECWDSMTMQIVRDADQEGVAPRPLRCPVCREEQVPDPAGSHIGIP